MAHVGAEAVGMRVRRVLAPQVALAVAGHGRAGLLALGNVRAQLLAARIEQRAHHGPVAVLHGAEPARPRAHDRTHVEALHAVVGRVRRENAAVGERRGRVKAQAFERLVRGQVALAAGDGFHVLARAPGLARDVDVAREQRDAQQLGQPDDEARVVVGVGAAQLVVDVQHGQLPQHSSFPQVAGDVSERRGVRSARYHQQRRRIGVGQSARRQHLPHAVDQRVRPCGSHHACTSKNLRSNSPSGRGRPNRNPWM